ncbi:MAG: DoxX-like family protein [Neisseriaceae bacterium]|nr:DoxX-like family protein [Neisseriaceae bacterium]
MKQHIPNYLPFSMGFLWAWSGLQPVLTQKEWSLQLLEQVGFGQMWQFPVLLLSSLLDLFFAVGCFLKLKQYSWFWLFQLMVVASYSLIIAFRLPENFLHPFAPLVKNIPILSLIFFLWRTQK